MSRPFDDTSAWWREELRALAQIVHQLHTEHGGTWMSCPMASCTRFRDVIAESGSSTKTVDLSPEEIVFVRVRRK